MILVVLVIRSSNSNSNSNNSNNSIIVLVIVMIIITTLGRSVNAREQGALKYAKLKTLANLGFRGFQPKRTSFFSGRRIPVSLPKTRVRVECVAHGISDL